MGVAGDAVLVDIIHCGIQMAGVENLELGLYVLLDHFRCQLVQEAGAVLKDVAVGPVQGVGVEGAHLRVEGGQMLQPLLVLVLAAGGGQVDDDVHVLLLTELHRLIYRNIIFHCLYLHRCRLKLFAPSLCLVRLRKACHNVMSRFHYGYKCVHGKIRGSHIYNSHLHVLLVIG